MKLKLYFSGGGFRATFFCLGAYRRLIELGLQNNIDSISSVSGGSIAAGKIIFALKEGKFENVNDFDKRVTKPLEEFGQCRLRNQLMKKVAPWIMPRTRLSKYFPVLLDKHLFHDSILKDLPEKPNWSINATCLNTGKRFRFKKDNIGGNLIGVSNEFRNLKLSYAVACSAAFPMMFAPLALPIKNKTFFLNWWTSNPVKNENKLPDRLLLSDGGVYDNLGSENLFHNTVPFLIFDASGFLQEWKPEEKPKWFSKNWRPLDASLDQVVLLRRRLIYEQSLKIYGMQLILRDPVEDMFKDSDEYGKLSDDKFDLPKYKLMLPEHQSSLSRMRTDLDGFHKIEIESLKWSGAVRVDIAIKRYISNRIKTNLLLNVPDPPGFDSSMVSDVLEKGVSRKYLFFLHKDLI